MLIRLPRPFLLALLLTPLLALTADAQIAVIQGRAWQDTDGDGIQDAAEPGFPDLTVQLVSAFDLTTPLQTTQTQNAVPVNSLENGSYRFEYNPTLVATQTVFVRFILPSGEPQYEFTRSLFGPSEQFDSNADAFGFAGPITLLPNGVRNFVDAGLRLVTDEDPDDDDTDDTGDDSGDDAADDTADDTDDDDDDDNVVTPPGGIEINAAGVLMLKRQVDGSRELDSRRAREMRAAADSLLARPSDSRKISLRRLEQAVAAAIESHGTLPDEIAYLAGLTRVKHVFLLPETQDVILAGPAEGFAPDEMGRMVGIKSGAATLLLEDLIVAVRSFPPDQQATPLIGCSIDPTQEGLERMQAFIRSVAGRMTPGDAARFAVGLKKSLGPQEVTVHGVPANTHFAQVLVEADYRMKLIGIGLETPPVPITTFVKRASPSHVSRNALQRWYFVPDYESVRVSGDGLAMELVGEGVKLVGADERVQQDGQRVRSGRVDRASEAFVRSFTERYDSIAREAPVFAQLRNLIDLSILAAFLQQEDIYGQFGWEMPTFRDESLLSVEIYRSPKTVEPAVNVVWKGGTLMTPIGGGVSIEAAKALSADHRLTDPQGVLREARDEVIAPQLAEGQWWWD